MRKITIEITDFAISMTEEITEYLDGESELNQKLDGMKEKIDTINPENIENEQVKQIAIDLKKK